MEKLQDLNTKPFKMFTPTKVAETYKFSDEEGKKVAHRAAQNRIEILGSVYRENKYHIKINEDNIQIRYKFVNTQEKL